MTSTMFKSLTRIGALAFTLAAPALSATASAHPEGEGGKGCFGPRRAEMLARYDANKDGKLDETEREAMRRDFAARRAEREQMDPQQRQQLREERARQRFQQLDADGNGTVTWEEFRAAALSRPHGPRGFGFGHGHGHGPQGDGGQR